MGYRRIWCNGFGLDWEKKKPTKKTLIKSFCEVRLSAACPMFVPTKIIQHFLIHLKLDQKKGKGELGVLVLYNY